MTRRTQLILLVAALLAAGLAVSALAAGAALLALGAAGILLAGAVIYLLWQLRSRPARPEAGRADPADTRTDPGAGR